jgi:putative DNA primase/helicase
VDRVDGKVIRPFVFARQADDGAVWAMGAPDGPRSLYGLEFLKSRPSDPVLIVEGEKTADAARSLIPSHVVMTWQGGANAVDQTDWAPLSNRDVIIWPDADTAGCLAAEKVAAILRLGNVSVRIIDTAGFPPKWDLADPSQRVSSSKRH